MIVNQQTRLIVPVPADTKKDSTVAWYEARVDAPSRSAYLDAFESRDKKLAGAETRLGTKGSFTTTIRDGSVELIIEAKVSRDVNGNLQLEGNLNGRKFHLYEQSGRLEAKAKPDLSETERNVVIRWSRLADSSESLAQAVRQSWGDGACALLYLGIGCSGVACCDGAIASCGAALVGLALAEENC